MNYIAKLGQDKLRLGHDYVFMHVVSFLIDYMISQLLK